MKTILRLSILISALLVSLCSCEVFHRKPPAGSLRVLVYGNDYSVDGVSGSMLNWQGGSYPAPKLGFTKNDAIQVGLALKNLAIKANMDYHIKYIVGHNLSVDMKSDLLDGRSEVIEDVSLPSFVDAVSSMGEAKDGDISIIYFSGHGFNGFNRDKVDYGTDVAKTSFLVMNETDASDTCDLYRISDFLKSVDMIPGAKVIIGDFCHSGALVPADYVSQTDNEYSAMDLSDLLCGSRDRIAASPSLFCLSASRYFEESHEDPVYGHGYFTYALLNALGWDEEGGKLGKAGAMNGGMITFLDIANYVAANDRDSGKPMFSGGSNDLAIFVF